MCRLPNAKTKTCDKYNINYPFVPTKFCLSNRKNIFRLSQSAKVSSCKNQIFSNRKNQFSHAKWYKFSLQPLTSSNHRGVEPHSICASSHPKLRTKGMKEQKMIVDSNTLVIMLTPEVLACSVYTNSGLQGIKTCNKN